MLFNYLNLDESARVMRDLFRFYTWLALGADGV